MLVERPEHARTPNAEAPLLRCKPSVNPATPKRAQDQDAACNQMVDPVRSKI